MSSTIIAQFVAMSAGITSARAQTVPEPILTRYQYAVAGGADSSAQYVIRSPAHFQTDVLVPGRGASMKLAAQADGAGLVRGVELDIWRFTPGQPKSPWAHAQHASYALVGDSIVGMVSGAGGEQTQRYPAPAGSMIFQWSYVSFLEQLVVRARALKVDSTDVPAYFFGTSGFVLPAHVRLLSHGDSAVVLLGEEEFHLSFDKYHRLWSATGSRTRISRVSQQTIFAADTSIVAGLHCPTDALRPDLDAIRSDPAVRTILGLYPSAQRGPPRLLRDETDRAICQNLLDLFPPQGAQPQLIDLGDAYMMVVGVPGARPGVGVISHDLSVIHFTRTEH